MTEENGTLIKMLRDKSAHIAVLGMGHVGLPLAVEFAKSGLQVLGFDTNEDKIATLASGDSYIADISRAELGVIINSGFLRFTSDPIELGACNVGIICVPTPLNVYLEPDVSMIVDAAGTLARHLASPALVVLESTSYPGTTEEILLPALTAAGRRLDDDLFVAFSSERVDPGNTVYKVRDIPKLAAGVTPMSSELVIALYRQAVDQVIAPGSVRVAESAKLLENVFRAVNIALVDEVKIIFDRLGIDIWEVIESAATKPFGYTPFFPGPGVGGDCIPVDPLYLATRAKQFGLRLRFVELAQEILDEMPHYVVQQVGDLLNSRAKAVKGANILLIGVAYKANVPDLSNSPSLRVADLLVAKGAFVRYHDPHVPRATLAGRELTSEPITRTVIRQHDCVVVLTDHADVDYGLIDQYAKMVVDTRGALPGSAKRRAVRQ